VSDALQAAVDAAVARFTARNPTSLARDRQRARAMPGGNTRTVLHLTPFPLTIARGEGARLTDVDDHVYVDFLGEFTAGLYGHSNPIILGAVREALADGIVLGAPNEYEAGLAQAVVDRFPSIELVRFCNSGTEANLLSISLARAATGRSKVMVFEGGYHGGVFLFATPNGSPLNAPFPYVVAPFNDAAAARRLIAEHGDDLACVVVEPLQGSAGCIPGDAAFLTALREGCDATGAVLVFDEVMTSRLSPGGLQLALGITPDLTSLGKYLGGGLTFGAFGGRRDLMERFDPSRPDALAHAGTFNNNVLTMAAGLAGLTQVYSAPVAERLNASGDALRERLTTVGATQGVPFQATGLGSMIGLHFGTGEIRRSADAGRLGAPTLERLRALLHLEMLERGYSYGRRGFLALSLPLTEEDHDGFVAAITAVLARHADLLRTVASASP
jgi:glutamate-1-semialdehyde 2,1-aminomutase